MGTPQTQSKIGVLGWVLTKENRETALARFMNVYSRFNSRMVKAWMAVWIKVHKQSQDLRDHGTADFTSDIKLSAQSSGGGMSDPGGGIDAADSPHKNNDWIAPASVIKLSTGCDNGDYTSMLAQYLTCRGVVRSLINDTTDSRFHSGVPKYCKTMDPIAAEKEISLWTRS